MKGREKICAVLLIFEASSLSFLKLVRTARQNVESRHVNSKLRNLQPHAQRNRYFSVLTQVGENSISLGSDGKVMDISRRLAWQVTLSDRYLSDPPGGFEQNHLLLTTGLKIKLGLPK